MKKCGLAFRLKYCFYKKKHSTKSIIRCWIDSRKFKGFYHSKSPENVALDDTLREIAIGMKK